MNTIVLTTLTNYMHTLFYACLLSVLKQSCNAWAIEIVHTLSRYLYTKQYNKEEMCRFKEGTHLVYL